MTEKFIIKKNKRVCKLIHGQAHVYNNMSELRQLQTDCVSCIIYREEESIIYSPSGIRLHFFYHQTKTHGGVMATCCTGVMEDKICPFHTIQQFGNLVDMTYII